MTEPKKTVNIDLPARTARSSVWSSSVRKPIGGLQGQEAARS